MEIWSALLSFGVVAALMTIIPGLDTALVLRSAISRGRTYAFAAAIGIGTGALTWGVAAAAGASALLAASAFGYRLLTLAGAGYLIWLGSTMLIRSLRRDRDHASPVEVAEPGGSVVRAWLSGFGTNLLNPKIGAFYLATLPQFIPEGTSPLLMGALLAMEHNLLGMIWFTMIIIGAGLAGRWLRRPAVTRICDRICGVVLVGFGVKLALQPRLG